MAQGSEGENCAITDWRERTRTSPPTDLYTITQMLRDPTFRDLDTDVIPAAFRLGLTHRKFETCKIFLQWLSIHPAIWYSYFNMEDDFARQAFNMVYLDWDQGTSENKIMCETPDIEYIFNWLEDEARKYFPNPAYLSGSTGPGKFMWQPPNYLLHLEERNTRSYYVGHKTIDMKQVERVREGDLHLELGQFLIERVCIREEETVQVMKFSPHPNGCKHCEQNYHTQVNWKADQKVATLQTVTRVRCTEFTRISLLSNGQVLLKTRTYLRHQPYGTSQGDSSPTATNRERRLRQ